jgi:hypothetical protein
MARPNSHVCSTGDRFTFATQRVVDDLEELTLVIAPAANLQFPARAPDFDPLPEFARAAGSLFAAAGGAGFLDHFFDRFTGFAGALLNAAQQFFLLACGVLKIVIRELGPLLFQLALGDVPVAFDFECGHNGLFCFCCLFSFAVNVAAKVFPQLAGFPMLGRGGESSYGV